MNDDITLQDGKLQEVARRLGARAAERLDVERTAQAVVTRLRTEPRADVRVLGIRPAWLRIAAALVILVGAGIVVQRLALDRPTPTSLATAAGADLNDLSADQLRRVLAEVGQPGGANEAVSWQDVSLEDLSAPQLRAVLESLEG